MEDFFKYFFGTVIVVLISMGIIVVATVVYDYLRGSTFMTRRRLIAELQDPAIRAHNLRAANISPTFGLVLAKRLEALVSDIGKTDLRLFSLIQLRVAELHEACQPGAEDE